MTEIYFIKADIQEDYHVIKLTGTINLSPIECNNHSLKEGILMSAILHEEDEDNDLPIHICNVDNGQTCCSSTGDNLELGPD